MGNSKHLLLSVSLLVLVAQGQYLACGHVNVTSDTVCSSPVTLSPCVHLGSWASSFPTGAQLFLTQQTTQCWPDPPPWVYLHTTQTGLSSLDLWPPPAPSIA